MAFSPKGSYSRACRANYSVNNYALRMCESPTNPKETTIPRSPNGHLIPSIKLDMKRFITYNALALFIAIGANFMGLTSFFITHVNPDYFRSIKVDQLYSINGFFRHVDTEGNYEFIYPNSWVVDQSVLIAKEMKREKPLILNNNRPTTAPDIAYSNPKSRGKENLSLIRSQVLPGFSLIGTLGTLQDAAPKLVELVAPASSGKTIKLLSAYSTGTDISNTPQCYIVEYRVARGENFNQHCISAITFQQSSNSLYTFTAMAPESTWTTSGDQINAVVSSFHLLKN